MLKSSCCGCSLQRGSLAIGWTTLVLQTLAVLICIGFYVALINDGPNDTININYASHVSQSSGSSDKTNDEINMKLSVESGTSHSNYKVPDASVQISSSFDKDFGGGISLNSHLLYDEDTFSNGISADNLRRKRDVYVNGKKTDAEDVIPGNENLIF